MGSGDDQELIVRPTEIPFRDLREGVENVVGYTTLEFRRDIGAEV